MTAEDREIYLYQMRMLDFLWRRNGQSVLDGIQEFEIAKAEKTWDGIAAGTGRTPRELVDLLWNRMGMEEGSGFEFAAREGEGGTIQMECTRCPFADLARAEGLEAVAFAKFCMSDYGIVRGFNPGMRFARTRTLMEGHDRCDHRYEPGDPPSRLP